MQYENYEVDGNAQHPISPHDSRSIHQGCVRFRPSSTASVLAYRMFGTLMQDMSNFGGSVIGSNNPQIRLKNFAESKRPSEAGSLEFAFTQYGDISLVVIQFFILIRFENRQRTNYFISFAGSFWIVAKPWSLS